MAATATAATPATATTTPGPGATSQRWLFGPVPDLLLGCGLLYAVGFVLFSLGGAEIRDRQPAYLMPLLILLVSMPHYGGTLVRVYDQRAERRQYVVFSVYATALVAALFVVGIYSTLVGALLITVYITWSPWHYTGQNYGVAVMMLRRRGADLAPPAKRFLYASFILSYVLVFLVFHTTDGGGVFSYNLDRAASGESPIRFLPLGVPHQVSDLAFPVALAGYVLSFLCAAGLLLRKSSLSDVAPALLLALTQALWFTLPFAVRFWRVQTGLEPLDRQFEIQDYVFWVALGHAVQYLWVTTYYARRSGRWSGYAPYFGKVLASGVAIWTLPVVLFAPDALGRLPYGGGLALVLAAAVNIHHFILDGAIWKLRNLKIGSILIRSESVGDADQAGAGRGWSLARRATWAVAATGLALALFAFWESEIRLPELIARGDSTSSIAVLDRLKWLGRDSASNRHTLGRMVARGSGDLASAAIQFERSLELNPTVMVSGELAFLYETQGDLEASMRALETGLRQFPDNPALLRAAGKVSLELDQPERAVELLERVVALVPSDPESRSNLERARSLLKERRSSVQ